MKIIFTYLFVAIFSLQTWAETESATKKGKALLSYALPSKLDWKQFSSEESVKDMQIFTLGEEKNIRLTSLQIGNENLWEKFSSLDKEKIYKELVAGKKPVHDLMGYKKWTATKSINKKSAKEIIFEIEGHFTQDNVKNYFIEKYYMTPYGFVLVSLDWSDKSDSKMAKKAREEFDNITFKSEIQ